MVMTLIMLPACTGGGSPTTTAPPAPTSTSSVTTSTTVAPTTTTTLPATVSVPGAAEGFGYRIQYEATVREAGSTDINLVSVTEGVLVDETDRFNTTTWFGDQLVEQVEIVVVGSEGWSKADRKPWLELTAIDVVSVDEATVRPEDFAPLYEILNDTEWTTSSHDGGTVRIYQLPTERAGELAGWLPDPISRDLAGVESYRGEVWLDVQSDYVVRFELEATGPESMLASGGFTEQGAGDLTLSLVYEFDDVNAPSLVRAAPPEVEEHDAPDGYYSFESDQFGFRLNAPLDWTLFPAESFDGFEVPFSAAPPLEVPNDSLFTVSIEDLASSQGLRVEDYAELNLRFITPFEGEVTEVRRSEPTELAGLPGWLTEADVEGPDESFTVRTITLIDGARGYSLEFYGWDGWFETDLVAAEVMFGSFELFDPTDSSA